MTPRRGDDQLRGADSTVKQLSDFFAQSQATTDLPDARLSAVQPFGSGIGARFHNTFCIPGGFQDIVRLSEDMYLNVFDETFSTDYMEETAGSDWLTLHCRLQGRTEEVLNGMDHIDRMGSQCYLILVPPGMKRTAHFCGGQRVRTVSVSFRANAATNLLGLTEQDFPPEMRSFVHGETAQSHYFQALTMPVPMLQAINDILDSPYSGNLRRLHAEAKCLELVSIMLAAMMRRTSEDVVPVRLRPYDVECLQRARLILEDRYADPPTISELAREVGINTKKLKFGFKHLFSETLIDYCYQVRMRHAQELLRKGGLTIAQISDRVGYSHPRNFTAAFRRHLGVLPKDYRGTV